ncbi:hypothetical protein MJO28_006090 [Puccinia striiformis f. sp. tritici]|uniref:Uncharacterized protein n=1 Tax=Puccinia striiformis f. sp. tritici TaxID=168172 RepID=A0ACC0EGF5_9BASI|nr:hypothetical protein MJO28_006090 [Puccinia striiformis f. sp. tritici]
MPERSVWDPKKFQLKALELSGSEAKPYPSSDYSTSYTFQHYNLIKSTKTKNVSILSVFENYLMIVRIDPVSIFFKPNDNGNQANISESSPHNRWMNGYLSKQHNPGQRSNCDT